MEAGSVKEVQMKLHASGEDYLETIHVLQKKRGMVRSVDVARHMEVSKPSVCHAVATLRDGGFLMMDEDHFLHLTDVGREVAEKIYNRDRYSICGGRNGVSSPCLPPLFLFVCILVFCLSVSDNMSRIRSVAKE